MNKQYTVIDKQYPALEWHTIDLAINDQNAGIIKLVDVGGPVALQLQVFDVYWQWLPVIAADLYLHMAGADNPGYANLQAATQAITAILAAHGWTEAITK